MTTLVDSHRKGGMASIYRSLDDPGRAYKIAHDNEKSEAMLKCEGKLLSDLRASRVAPRPYGVTRVNAPGSALHGRLMLAMEWLEGASLAAVSAWSGPLPEPLVASLAHDACAAGATLHGFLVVHRDLNPGNLFLCSDGTLRIIDFGTVISKGTSDHTLITNGHEPPENRAPRDLGRPIPLATTVYEQTADVFTLASTLASAMLGDVVTSPDALTGPDSAFRLWLKICLDKRPDCRFANFAAAFTALRTVVPPTSAEMLNVRAQLARDAMGE